jgi:hypothetical protein
MAAPLPDNVRKGTFNRPVNGRPSLPPREKLAPDPQNLGSRLWASLVTDAWTPQLPVVSASTTPAPILDNDDLAPNPVEIAVVGFAEGNANLQRYSGVSLRMHHLTTFIRRHGSEFIAELWIAQPEAWRLPKLPFCVVVAAKLGSSYSGPDKLSGLRLLDAADPAVNTLP